ncbi:MAG: class I SAM-dependent methyltransferase [Actinobacteria bacterium]|nr:class I SAM-dependent methyltransferase [Actinomycetota bacterium]
MQRLRRRREASPRLGPKHLAELAWWERALHDRVEWYRGERTMYGRRPPTSDEKHVRETIEASAGVTTVAVSLDRYPDALKIPRDHFVGKTILDLGCGPYPLSIAFDDCRIVGLDPLILRYEAAGFPLDEFTDRVTFVRAFAEDMPFPARSFDAVISVNAIDHVDDFALAAREISRVLKKDGILRLQVHYHPPTELEPQALGDDDVLRHLGHLGIEKISEEVPPGRARDPDSVPAIDPDERLVVWANDG